MGLFKVKSMGYKKCIISLIDDFTKYMEVHFLFKKSDASYVFQTFCEKIKIQIDRYYQSFCSDQGGKHINAELTKYFETKGIQYLIITIYSPESNTIAEHFNQTLVNIVQPSLDYVPISLWAEVFNWACYLKNRLLYSVLIDRTPYEILSG